MRVQTRQARGNILSGETGVLALVLSAAAYVLALTHPIDLLPADLGRHLKNGWVFLHTFSPPATNLYSFTHPDFPTLTHHWGSGVLFYLVWRAAGFLGLHLFFIALSLAAFAIFFQIAKQRAGAGLAAMLMLAAAPLLAERSEVRPEAFSYLLCGIFYWMLVQAKAGKLSPSRLWLLPVLEVVWVNLHIYFFLGPAFVFFFLIQARVESKTLDKTLLRLFLWTCAASLLNPSGLRGAIGPATIFLHYGYRVAENQPVWVIEKLLANPDYFIFKLWFGALLLSYVVRRALAKSWPPASSCLLGAMTSAMAWLAIRNFALFGLFATVLAAENLAALLPKLIERRKAWLRWIAYACGIIGFWLAASGRGWAPFHVKYPLGVGLNPENESFAAFLKDSSLRGPIFNDYDIGSCLIFYLYPREKVFVDNRPEAYPESFFKDVYVPMQENEDEWKKQDARYRFNSIVFSMKDLTPWAQAFLIRRVQDIDWAPVFADGAAIVFVRRAPANAWIISHYEIPRGAFFLRK